MYITTVAPPSRFGLRYSRSGWPSMIRPSPSFISACPTLPSCLGMRIVSSNPNARARKSSAAAASSYKRYGLIFCVMAQRLRRCGRRVLEKSFGRPAGDGTEVVDQMRLVVVTALERDLGPGQPTCEPARPFEAEQPRDRLRRQADLL